MWVYSRYITKNGVRIYPKTARYFRFWVDDDAPAQDEAVCHVSADENHQQDNTGCSN